MTEYVNGRKVNDNYYTRTETDELLSSITPSSDVGSFLISGGNVVWTSGLNFRVSAASYYIDSSRYTSVEQSIELDAADDTNDRIDVIALDTSGSLVKITGTPAESPSRPDIDPATQLQLTFVLVPATATEPSGISTTDLYLENAGTPTEWAATSSGATINVDSTNNPRTGSKCIELTSAANTNWFMLAAGSLVDLANQSALVFYIRSKATWASQKSMRISFRLNGVVTGNYVTLDEGLFGFSSAITADYQQIAIPISQFSVPANASINQLMFEVRGSGGNIGTYFDDIILQGGSSQNTTGITQDQADARYLRIANNLSDISGSVTARTNIGAAALTHATQHKSSGSDSIKLDELAAPTDVTTLNASASAHGLLPKLSGDASDVLKGDGTWGTSEGGSVDILGIQVFC